MQSLRSAAPCLLCSMLCQCFVMAVRACCPLVRLPLSIFVGACAVVLVMSVPNAREPALAAVAAGSRQEILAATISVCVVVGYISTLYEPIHATMAVFVAEALQPPLKKWWPTPKPPPPPPPPFWCPWTEFPGFFIDAWKDRCWERQIKCQVDMLIFDSLDWWLPTLALGFIMASIVFHVPVFVFRGGIANSYVRKHNLPYYSKFSVDDKCKMCLGIIAWACILSTLPALPSGHALYADSGRTTSTDWAGMREPYRLYCSGRWA